MSDFNTALGILQKAMQGNLFAKHKSAHTNLVEGDHHPKILGTTRSGKEVLGKPSSSPDKFLEHHRGWIANDHEDATDIHHDHQNHASLALSRKWLLAPSFDAVDYLASSRRHHEVMGRLHGELSDLKHPQRTSTIELSLGHNPSNREVTQHLYDHYWPEATSHYSNVQDAKRRMDE